MLCFVARIFPKNQLQMYESFHSQATNLLKTFGWRLHYEAWLMKVWLMCGVGGFCSHGSCLGCRWCDNDDMICHLCCATMSHSCQKKRKPCQSEAAGMAFVFMLYRLRLREVVDDRYIVYKLEKNKTKYSYGKDYRY